MKDASLLSAVEIAERLGVSERTVRRWIKSGRLTAARHGRSFAIHPRDADAIRPVRENHAAEIAELRGRYFELARQIERLESRLVNLRAADAHNDRAAAA